MALPTLLLNCPLCSGFGPKAQSLMVTRWLPQLQMPGHHGSVSRVGRKGKETKGLSNFYSVLLLPEWKYSPPTPGSLLFMTYWSKLGIMAIPAYERSCWVSTWPTGNFLVTRSSDQAQCIPRPGSVSCGKNQASMCKNRGGDAMEPSSFHHGSLFGMFPGRLRESKSCVYKSVAEFLLLRLSWLLSGTSNWSWKQPRLNKK